LNQTQKKREKKRKKNLQNKMKNKNSQLVREFREYR
jgi:hypothetical protein